MSIVKIIKEDDNLSEIKDNISSILAFLPSSIKLVCVSKTRTIEEMEEAYNIGIRDFGENKVQELISKYDDFHKDVNWHLIGHLQTNKVKYIVGKVTLIHSLDSIDLLKELEKRFSKAEKIAECLIQINIGQEESKTGVSLMDLESLIEACENCSSVKVKGLMGIIPNVETEECRNYFKALKKIYDEKKKNNYKNISMEYLSMGMTGDYKAAVEEGSNIVRIGTGIFGKRIYNK